MEEEELIRIQWHIDRTKEPCDYTLISLHPDYPDLTVRVSSSEMSERSAKAKLMEMMYQLGEQRGIRGKRLRFKINGVED